MRDQRLEKLAKTIVNYSLEIQENEIVRINCLDIEAKPLAKELVKLVHELKAIPIVEIKDDEINRCLLENASEEQIKIDAKWELQKCIDADVTIWLLCRSNEFELANIPKEIMSMKRNYFKEGADIRNAKKWILLNYPTNSFAQAAKMPYDAFYDFSMDVMALDYKYMHEACIPLKELMDKTDNVKIKGQNVDLEFSIKNIGSVICAGKKNIPDGEVYSCPIKDSVNGYIKYNTPSPYAGSVYNNVTLTFENGKIINCSADNDNEKLEEIFNSDEGARFIGEFAIGLNPMINTPMGDILYDEKIAGSFHFTPGQAYKEAYNGNNSSIHWDMVLIQTPEYGGGEIYFDDVLIRKDGLFVIDELKSLNPENFLKTK